VANGNLDRVELRLVDPSLDHFVANRIDWCRVEGVPDLPHRFPQETLLTQHLETYFLGFACRFSPFDHRLVRQAFAHSIDKKTLVSEIWGDVHKTAVGGAVPAGMPGHSPEIGLTYDPPAAQALLEAALGSDSNLPPLTLGTVAGFRTTPEYLQKSWREHLGIEVQIITVDYDEMFSGLQDGSIQLALLGWSVDYPDPDAILRVLLHGASPVNGFGWQNGHYDDLVEQAANSTDQQVRLALYHQADRLLVAGETAIVPLYYRREYALLRAGFRLAGAGKIVRGGNVKLKNIVDGRHLKL
jgi:oligopeptide transport system substrate-binding protein